MKKIKEVLKSIGIVFFAIFLPWVIFCIRLKPETQERIRTVTKVVIPIMCVVLMFATPIIVHRIKHAEELNTLKGEMIIEFYSPNADGAVAVKLSELTEENNTVRVDFYQKRPLNPLEFNPVQIYVSVKTEGKYVVKDYDVRDLSQKGYVRKDYESRKGYSDRTEYTYYVYRNKDFDSLRYSGKFVFVYRVFMV